MTSLRAISSSLPILRPRVNLSRSLATNVHRLPGQDEERDFRPPWLYTMSRLLSYTLIPSAAIYGLFFHDFGEREHVFQPPRRWLARHKAAFFTLSPEEQKILQIDANPAPPPSASKEP